MDLEKIRSNRVKTILQFSIPSIIAMVLTSLITVVDGFFIGNYVGEEGVASVNLGLPIVYLFLAVGLMVSVGGMAIAGMQLGAGEIAKCNQVFRQTMLTSGLVTVCLSVIVFLCFEPVLSILKAEGQVAAYFKEYYWIILFQLPLMVINSSFGMFIRGEGNPQYFMMTNIVNVLLNIVLDYAFAKWMHWGVAGIAAASLISTAVSLLLILYFFAKVSEVYKLGRFAWDGEVFKNTILNGSSEFIGEMSSCVSMFAYNLVIMRNIGVDGVAAFTIVGYVFYIFSMILIGFGQGISPLVSFTYGAHEYQLAGNIRRKTNELVFGAGVVVMGLMLILADWYSNLFVDSASVKTMVQSGLGICMVSFLFSGINTIASFYFTSIGKAKESAVISSARGLVIILVCIFTFPVLFGMTGVWLVAPVTEGITILISLGYMVKDDKRVRRLCTSVT